MSSHSRALLTGPDAGIDDRFGDLTDEGTDRTQWPFCTDVNFMCGPVDSVTSDTTDACNRPVAVSVAVPRRPAPSARARSTTDTGVYLHR